MKTRLKPTKFRLYLAGPLFSTAERNFNVDLVKILRKKFPSIKFLVPQEQSKQFEGQPDFLEKVFHNCISSVYESNALLCILDGSDVDSGTSIEMGYAYALKKPIIGVRTDFRRSEDRGVNLMVSRVCTEMISIPSYEANIDEIAKRIVPVLNRVIEKAPK